MAEFMDGDFVIVSHEDSTPLMTAAASPPFLDEISAFVDSIADELWPINKKIHDNPELAFKEFLAHDTLTAYVESKSGWKVSRSIYGMETAWMAEYDSGKAGPIVSFNIEMDALPGIGHACGHNLIATASLAGGLAAAKMMTDLKLKGKIILFGTPAEENGGGKIRLLRAGAYRDHKVDISLISHPGIGIDTAMMRTTAHTSFRAAYTGRAAHAAVSPWLGINALDALVVAYTAFSVLRQQTMPGDIIQGHITDGGAASNIIHEHAAGVFAARAPTRARLAELRTKVEACFVAGATATGAKLDITPRGEYADHVPNRVLAATYVPYWNALNGEDSRIPLDPDEDGARGRTGASTDQGDISYAMPSLSPGFGIPPGPERGDPHSIDFEKAAGTREAFDCALRVAKALAGTAVEVLDKKGLLEEVRERWKKDMKEAKGVVVDGGMRPGPGWKGF